MLHKIWFIKVADLCIAENFRRFLFKHTLLRVYVVLYGENCYGMILLEVDKTKSQNSPTLKNSQKVRKMGTMVQHPTRSNSEKVINFEITDFSMYGDFLPKIDANFL